MSIAQASGAAGPRPMTKEEKDLLKKGVDKLSAADVTKAAKYLFSQKLKDRARNGKEANAKTTTADRVGQLTTTKRGQKVEMTINGARHEYVVVIPNTDGRYTDLIDSKGAYATIDRQGGTCNFAYKKNPRDTRAVSIEMPATPPVITPFMQKDSTVIYLAAKGPAPTPTIAP